MTLIVMTALIVQRIYGINGLTQGYPCTNPFIPLTRCTPHSLFIFKPLLKGFEGVG